MEKGRRSNNLDPVAVADDFVVHREGSLFRQKFNDLAMQLSGAGAVSKRLASLDVTAAGGAAYTALLSDLRSSPEPYHDKGGYVLMDPVVDNNGVWRYDEDLADWVKIAPLPHTIAQLINVGGDGNLVTAETDVGIDAAEVLFLMVVPTVTNTGAVSLALNGGAAVPVQSASGAPLVEGDFRAGVGTILYKADGGWRQLFSSGIGQRVEGHAALASASAEIANEQAGQAIAGAAAAQQDRLLAEAARDGAVLASENLGYGYSFSAGTSDADPGPAHFRFNAANFAAANMLYISETAREGGISGAIDVWDDSNSAKKATVRIRNPLDVSQWCEFYIVGNTIDAGDYRKIPIEPIAANGAFANGAALLVGVFRNGDAGTGAVDSFAGRSGAVLPVASDYAPWFAQLGLGNIFAANQTVRASWPSFALQKLADGEANQIVGNRADGSVNWVIRPGNAADWFTVERFDVAGNWLDSPIAIDPSSGVVDMAHGSLNHQYKQALLLAAGSSINDAVGGGAFVGHNLADMPFELADWWYVERIDAFGDGNYAFERVAPLNLSGANRTWTRHTIGGVERAWAPECGYVTPAHFGAVGGDDIAAARLINDAAALRLWLASRYPKRLDRFYATSEPVQVSLAGVNGIDIQGSGSARSGLVLTDPASSLSIVGADYDNPAGASFDKISLSGFSLVQDAALTVVALTLSAVDGDSGSSSAGIAIDNFDIIRTANGHGSNVAAIRLRNIRNGHISNVSINGRYFAYEGVAIDFVCGENGAPVELKITNVRMDHWRAAVKISPAEGSTPNDDWQGIHLRNCEALAVNKMIEADGGPEGFAEWLTVDGCHAYFREVAIDLVNVTRPNISNNNFIAHGNFASCGGIKSSFELNKSQYGQWNHNMIDLSAATGAERFGIVVGDNLTSAVRGVAIGNEQVSATMGFSLPATMQRLANGEH